MRIVAVFSDVNPVKSLVKDVQDSETDSLVLSNQTAEPGQTFTVDEFNATPSLIIR